jgi:hypothetical protein
MGTSPHLGEIIMIDIADLASKCGIRVEQARNGFGALLAFCKEKLPPEIFSKVSEAVPNAQGLIAGAAETGKEATGGVLSAVSGLAGKLFGGGASEVVSKFSQFGFSADQIQSFLPKVMEALKDKLPEDVMKKVSGLLPMK